MKRTFPTIAATAAVLTGALAGHGFAQATPAPAAAAVSTGITAPSDVRKIGFDLRGVVAKVEVKKNDTVKAGQSLLSLGDAEERATLEMYKLAADAALEVSEAQQTYELKKIDYERKQGMFENGQVASEFEVRTAKTEMEIAKIRIDKARHEAAQNQARADAQSARLEKMKRVVPNDFPEGQVSEVTVKEGEQVDETKPVVELVDLDPLYVNLTLVDTAVVQRLKLGDTLRVKYGDESRWRDATVDAIDPSANSASGKHPFRLRLPNPEMRNAGLRVEVQLPSTGVAGTN